jgi:hypothetical protein
MGILPHIHTSLHKITDMDGNSRPIGVVNAQCADLRSRAPLAHSVFLLSAEDLPPSPEFRTDSLPSLRINGLLARPDRPE